MVKGLLLYSTVLSSSHSKCESKATATSSGAVWVRCLAHGHFNTLLGGAGIELATFQLPANLSFLLSHMPQATCIVHVILFLFNQRPPNVVSVWWTLEVTRVRHTS